MNFKAATLTKPGIIIPALIFLLAKTFAAFIAYQGNCHSGLHPDCFVRWDSALYMQIAEIGHTLFHCGPEQGYPSGSMEWCGNSGWAPLYPFFMAVLSKITGLSLAISGMLISTVFYLGYLLICARLANISDYKSRNWLIMIIFAFCPGNIYFHAVFPLAQVAFFLSLFFLCLRNEKYLTAGIAGFLAVLSYSIGFFLLAILGIYGIYMLLYRRERFFDLGFKTGLPTLCGLLTLFTYDYFSTGYWNALFLIQTKYGHGINSPWKMFGLHWNKLFSEPYSLKSWNEIQNLFMVFYILGAVIYTALNKAAGKFRVFHALYLTIFWFLPYSTGMDVALYRNSATLGPAHSALRSSPLWLIALIAVIFMLLSYPLGILFIQSTIV